MENAEWWQWKKRAKTNKTHTNAIIKKSARAHTNANRFANGKWCRMNPDKSYITIGNWQSLWCDKHKLNECKQCSRASKSTQLLHINSNLQSKCWALQRRLHGKFLQLICIQRIQLCHWNECFCNCLRYVTVDGSWLDVLAFVLPLHSIRTHIHTPVLAKLNAVQPNQCWVRECASNN